LHGVGVKELSVFLAGAERTHWWMHNHIWGIALQDLWILLFLRQGRFAQWHQCVSALSDIF
jgi:hypothetical protein